MMPNMRSYAWKEIFRSLVSSRTRNYYKITIIGDHGVGKTALAQQFCYDIFVQYNPTFPAIEDRYFRQVTVDDQTYTLEIHDTSGSVCTNALRRHLANESNGIIAVYGINSDSSFSFIKDVLVGGNALASNLEDQCPPAHVGLGGWCDLPIALVANKQDKDAAREVSLQEGHALARYLGCSFYEISARKGDDVILIFSNLIREIRSLVRKRSGNDAGGLRRESSRTEKDRKCVIL
ncbi:ras family domain-containing protein [Purpureocillium lilacinum]|uniref:Ras family domain-containing protein n=1 Tax=Purpureocillium lilacinum TaxID=33203 RepID=A0A179F7D0_PURLI|nr:ras family domain-containing protein [Purpureocillium lilacinum]